MVAEEQQNSRTAEQAEQQNKLNNRTADSRRVCHIHRSLLVCEYLRELVGLLED
jgi:hypothetical protein